MFDYFDATDFEQKIT